MHFIRQLFQTMRLGLVMDPSCNLAVSPSKDIVLSNTVKSFLVCFSHSAAERVTVHHLWWISSSPYCQFCGNIPTLCSLMSLERKNNFLFDLARSSDFSVQIQEEVFTKSSQAACSCCHCQKQSELLGLRSHSRKSRGAGKYSGQFSACWVKCLTNTWWSIQQLFVSERHSILPTVYTISHNFVQLYNDNKGILFYSILTHRYLPLKEHNTQTHTNSLRLTH